MNGMTLRCHHTHGCLEIHELFMEVLLAGKIIRNDGISSKPREKTTGGYRRRVNRINGIQGI
jgi:hypothetical protein